MRKLFVASGEIDPATRIMPLDWGEGYEDYQQDYGMVDYTEKVVLDVGADVGSSADYFLRAGARRVVAVEGHDTLFHYLRENSQRVPGIIPVHMMVMNSGHFVRLITNAQPDVVKCDIESNERFLFQVPDDVFRQVPEYIIEVHNDQLLDCLKDKCAACGYTMVNIEPRQREELYIVYIKREH